MRRIVRIFLAGLLALLPLTATVAGDHLAGPVCRRLYRAG